MASKGAVNPEANSFPVVGIGASAGGLKAVSLLLTHLPPKTGMAFVVVQHLDPTRESFLSTILQRATEMPVTTAKDGSFLAPNVVFVIPPNTHMVVSGRQLKLMPRPKGVHAMSVNCFLNSLAEECGNKAIAVILSGTANDGTLGIKAIKSEGGIVFAQDEQSSEHYGMPQSAAATGVVDFILSPQKIADELASIAQHPVLRPDIPVLFEDTKSLSQIFMLLRQMTGVDFSLYKPNTIKRRLLRRLMLRKFVTLEEYKTFLVRNSEEVRALHDDLLIHVTHFFREPQAIAALRAKAFPRILKDLPPDAPIRVWVPGCSTGEEPYSLAIELLDYLSERDRGNPIQIFATDISEIALARARAGAYSDEIQNDVPPRLLRRFFNRVDRGYEIIKSVRDACVFARQDLTKDPPFANVDLISCCNVLIYLGPTVQKKILPMFHQALRASGTLFLGSSETVGEFGDLFAQADKKHRLYYKKSVEGKMRVPVVVEPVQRMSQTPRKGRAAVAPGWPETDVQKVAERILLSQYAPAGLIIDGDLNVLHFRGHLSRYLAHGTGKANLSLLKMLPAHAAATVSSMIQKARKTDAPVKESGIEVGEDDDSERTKSITIKIVPFRLPISGHRYFIVLFEESSRQTARTMPAKQVTRPPMSEGATVRRLKNELASTRGYLQTINEEHEAAGEELKAANEEITASNEELQSTNEELGVAKEELQAANEELSTVNEELQTRNGDLGHLNNDLLNLIASVHLAIIMVSRDLRIRRFSTMAEKVMHLTSGDVGRPIGDIKLKMALPNIEEVIHGVIETAIVKELEVRDQAGHSYVVRIRPYKTTENQIAGVVIVFIDNDPIARSILGIKQLPAFEAVLNIGHPLVVLDEHMRIKTVSRSMYQAFGLTPSSLGQSLFEVSKELWNVPELRSQLELLAQHGEPFHNISFPIGGRLVSFSGCQIKTAVDEPPLVLLSIDS